MFDMSEKLKKGKGEEGEGNGLFQSKNSLNMLNSPEILTGMSHEMRTHMNAIVAFSFLMGGKDTNRDERAEFSDYIIKSCEQLIHLFDNFLDSAIIDTGKPFNDVRRCNLSELFHELAVEFRAIIPKYDQKSIELIVDDKGINSGEVYIDVNKVSRVIHNLFLNAIENTNRGYIRLGYNLSSEEVVFYVLDSGQSFQKGINLLNGTGEFEDQTSTSHTQVAVSFLLAKKLIALMRGELWIEQNGVSGSGIYFSVPVKELALSVSSEGKKELKTKMLI